MHDNRDEVRPTAGVWRLALMPSPSDVEFTPDAEIAVRRLALTTLMDCSGVAAKAMEALLIGVVRGLVSEQGVSPRDPGTLELAHRGLVLELARRRMGRSWNLDPAVVGMVSSELRDIVHGMTPVEVVRSLGTAIGQLLWHRIQVLESDRRLVLRLVPATSPDPCPDGTAELAFARACVVNTLLVFLHAVFAPRAMHVVECSRMDTARSVSTLMGEERVFLSDHDQIVIDKRHLSFERRVPGGRATWRGARVLDMRDPIEHSSRAGILQDGVTDNDGGRRR